MWRHLSNRGEPGPTRRAYAALALVSALVSCAPPPKLGESGFACVERLRIPRFSQVAQSARVQPELKVAIRLGPNARLASYSVDPLPPGYRDTFESEIKKTVTLSQYSANCAGKTIEIVLVFRMDGAFGDSGNLVWFEPPNRFTITATAEPINTRPDS